MIKSDLRKILKAKRSAIEKDEKIEKNKIICREVVATDMFRDAETVMVYISSFGEVDTKKIISVALTEEKNVLVPVVDGDEMYPCVLKSLDRLVPGAYGIGEPDEKEKWTGDIDLCIVPGIGFDRKGGRIGFGKGYYDKFLSGTSCRKMGIAFSEQIENDVFSEPHDVSMDVVITEKELIYCG